MRVSLAADVSVRIGQRGLRRGMRRGAVHWENDVLHLEWHEHVEPRHRRRYLSRLVGVGLRRIWRDLRRIGRSAAKVHEDLCLLLI